jgi:hypothetical protein
MNRQTFNEKVINHLRSDNCTFWYIDNRAKPALVNIYLQVSLSDKNYPWSMNSIKL